MCLVPAANAKLQIPKCSATSFLPWSEFPYYRKLREIRTDATGGEVARKKSCLAKRAFLYRARGTFTLSLSVNIAAQSLDYQPVSKVITNGGISEMLKTEKFSKLKRKVQNCDRILFIVT